MVKSRAGAVVTTIAGLLTLMACCSCSRGSAAPVGDNVLVSSGGREARLPWNSCDPTTLTATESARSVTLVLTSGPEPSNCDFTAVKDVTVSWRHPLGHRALIDGTTGKPIAYIDTRDFPRAAYLPPGYSLSPRYQSGGHGSWTCSYGNGSPQASASLSLTVAPHNAPGPFFVYSGSPMVVRKQTVTVHGKPASLQALWTYDPYARRLLYLLSLDIYWHADGFTFDAHSDKPWDHGQPFPAAVLTRFANGLAA
jgi:hypothetical protein